MGRMMPVECPHGVILSWGDFGGANSKGETCALCDDESEAGFASDILDALRAFGPGVEKDLGVTSLFVARHIRSANEAARNGGPT